MIGEPRAREMRMPPLPARVSDPLGRASEIDRRLFDILTHASRYLPEGCRVEIVSSGDLVGQGRIPWLGSSSRHAAGLALEVRLISPNGRPLAMISRTQRSELWRSYRLLADLMFQVQRLVYPALTGQLAWGGKFAGFGGLWHVGHFDLAGFRGRGSYQPPRLDDAPAIMVRELGQPDDDGPPAAA